MERIEQYSDHVYGIFRIVISLLFIQHGAQKLFGFFGGDPVSLMSLMGAAGIIEFIGGILIMIGFFTRWIALLASAEMFVAYFMAHHATDALFPITNGGENTLLFAFGFLLIATMGARKWALDVGMPHRS